MKASGVVDEVGQVGNPGAADHSSHVLSPPRLTSAEHLMSMTRHFWSPNSPFGRGLTGPDPGTFGLLEVRREHGVTGPLTTNLREAGRGAQILRRDTPRAVRIRDRFSIEGGPWSRAP